MLEADGVLVDGSVPRPGRDRGRTAVPRRSARRAHSSVARPIRRPPILRGKAADRGNAAGAASAARVAAAAASTLGVQALCSLGRHSERHPPERHQDDAGHLEGEAIGRMAALEARREKGERLCRSRGHIVESPERPKFRPDVPTGRRPAPRPTPPARLRRGTRHRRARGGASSGAAGRESGVHPATAGAAGGTPRTAPTARPAPSGPARSARPWRPRPSRSQSSTPSAANASRPMVTLK